MSGDHEGAVTSGLTRRQILTRGAIAGGIVWAAPIIRTTAAYATTANGTERPCTNFFMVTINPSGKVKPQPNDLNTRDVPPAIRQWFRDNPGVTVQFPASHNAPLLTQTSSAAWAVLLPEVTGPNASGRQCRMVIGWDEKRHKYAEGYVDPNPPLSSEVGRRLIFPCPDPNHTGGGGDGDHDGDDEGTGKGPKNDGDTDDIGRDSLSAPDAPGSTSSTSSPTTTPDGSISASNTATANSPAVGSIASDGTASSSISSDGNPSQTITSDGKPSTNTPPTTPNGPGECINLVYLIYCCPQ